jgi:hypothetical protein
MLDSIINSLKGEVSSDLQQKAGVESSNIDGIMDVVKSVASKKIGAELLSGGGLGNVMNLFTEKQDTTAANSLQTKMTTGVVAGLVEKMGFSKEKAASVTNVVIPVLIKLISKKNDKTPADDSSALTKIFGGSAGASDISKKLGGLF